MRQANRDNRQVKLAHISTLSGSLLFVKRGHWVKWVDDESGAPCCGRVIGRVLPHNDGLEPGPFVEVAALTFACQYVGVRWIKPENILHVWAGPPKAVFDWLCGDWSDANALHADMHYGGISSGKIAPEPFRTEFKP